MAELDAVLQWLGPATEIAIRYGMEPSVILAIIWVESRGDPMAFNAVSRATGLMQVMPKEAGPPFEDRPTIMDLKDARINIEWGVKILAYCQKKANGDLWRALYYYSGGSTWKSTPTFTRKYWRPFVAARYDIKMALREKATVSRNMSPQTGNTFCAGAE